jgi:hypothetical protein
MSLRRIEVDDNVCIKEMRREESISIRLIDQHAVLALKSHWLEGSMHVLRMRPPTGYKYPIMATSLLAE